MTNKVDEPQDSSILKKIKDFYDQHLKGKWEEIWKKVGVDLSSKVIVGIILGLSGAVVFIASSFLGGKADIEAKGTKTNEISQVVSSTPCTAVNANNSGSIINNIRCETFPSADAIKSLTDGIAFRLSRRGVIPAEGGLGLGPGLDGIQLGMTLDEIKNRYTIEEKKPSTNSISDVYLPGYYNAKEIVRIADFDYGISLHFTNEILDFISLHQWFPKDAKIPDFSKVEKIFSTKYGEPARIWTPTAYDQEKKLTIWLPKNGIIELNNFFSAEKSDPDVIQNSSIIYFTPSDHGLVPADAASPLDLDKLR